MLPPDNQQVKQRATVGRMSAENSLLKFVSSQTPEAAVLVMLACAATGEECWVPLLDKEMAERIAANSILTHKLMTGLCKQPGLPYSYVIMETFLTYLNSDAIENIFSPAALKKRSNPAIVCFYNASFSSPSGHHLTKVLEILIRFGLPVEAVALKNIADLERAASFGHRDFLKIIIPELSVLPDEVIKSAMIKSMFPMNSISILVDECNISLKTLAQPRIMASAKPEARSYISARMTRMERIPETIFNEIDGLDGPLND